MNQPTDSWVRIGPLSSLSFAPGHLAKVQDQEIAIFADGGQYFALDNTCSHQGGPLCEGDLIDGKVMCPWHGWQFDVRNGDCVTARGAGVRTYPTRVVDGQLEIELA